MSMKIAIIGQGYVGLNVASSAISVGHHVLGIDSNVSLVSNLNSGISHIEGVPRKVLVMGLESGKYRATVDFSDISQAEIVLVAVPTPLNNSGEPNTVLLEKAVDSIAPHLSAGTLVINESTSFIGTLRNIIAKRIVGLNSKITDFVVSPERVDPGNPNFNIKNTPRIVGGLNASAIQRAVDFYSSFCDEVVKVSTPEVAEAAKLLENSYRFINIGFINEFAQLMNIMGIPISEVISSASTKPYGFMPFLPNVGVGGHCIPVDPLYLQKNARDANLTSRYIELSEKLNLEMPKYSVERLELLSGPIIGKHVLVVGVSYKPDIADTRESPAGPVIENLKKYGAKVSWHDPLVTEFNGEKSSPILGEYDLALVLVKHQNLDLGTWSGKPIYCVNSTPSEPNWIPLFGSQNHK